MGIFFTSTHAPLPAIRTAIQQALLFDPNAVANVTQEAADRTVNLANSIAPTFNVWRFAGALAIAAVLLGMSIWTAQHELPDISKSLMDLFSGFGGLVLGLLGGEAQKAST
jgi:hypothetical protein